jgi:erythromycin esterase
MFVAMAEGAWLDAVNLRDRAMAEQLLWLASEVHPDARIVLWAHNGHVARSTRSVPDERLRGRMIPMGRHLARELGDALVVFGFACGTGRDRDLDVEVDLEPVEPDSLDGALSRVGPQRFVVDLRRAPDEGPVRGWLARRHRVRYMASYEEMVPIEAFDALFFVDTTSPTRPRPAALARFRAGPTLQDEQAAATSQDRQDRQDLDGEDRRC